MRWPELSILLISLIFSPFAAWAEAPSGLVRGYVVDESNLEPVPGVLVSYGDLVTTSDAKGTFTIAAPMGGGTHNITLRGADYLPVTTAVTCQNGVVTERDFLLLRSHSFGGVGTFSGNILLGYRPGKARITSPNHPSFHFDTHDDGTFSVDLVPAGYYQVQIQARGYTSRFTEVTVIDDEMVYLFDVNLVGELDYVPPPLKVEIHDGFLFTNGRINFKLDSDIIELESFNLLNLIAAVLKTNTWIKFVTIEGHTSLEGTYQHNMDLSRKRALSVGRFLVSVGISESALIMKGYGPTLPIAPNTTEENRLRNRRVDFRVTGNPNPELFMPDTPPERADKPRLKPKKKTTKRR